jgi:hypothetical protein
MREASSLIWRRRYVRGPGFAAIDTSARRVICRDDFIFRAHLPTTLDANVRDGPGPREADAGPDPLPVQRFV